MHLVDGGQRLEAAVWGEEEGGAESHMVAVHAAALPLVCWEQHSSLLRSTSGLMKIVSNRTFFPNFP